MKSPSSYSLSRSEGCETFWEPGGKNIPLDWDWEFREGIGSLNAKEGRWGWDDGGPDIGVKEKAEDAGDA